MATRKRDVPPVVPNPTIEATLALPNVAVRSDRETVTNEQMRVSVVYNARSIFTAFIYNVAVRNPTWGFVYTHSNEVSVEHGGIEIGTAKMVYISRASTHGIRIACDRIRAKRQRSGHYQTDNLERVLKEFAANFQPRDISLAFQRLSNQGVSELEYEVTVAKRNVTRAQTAVEELAVQFVREHAQEAFIRYLQSDPDRKAKLDAREAAFESVNDMRTFAGLVEAGRASYVGLIGDNWVWNDNGVVHECAADALPAKLLSAYVLKVVAKGGEVTKMPGIGVRFDSNVMLVVHTGEENETA